jgi:uncharacterized protein (TIGR02145 family)
MLRNHKRFIIFSVILLVIIACFFLLFPTQQPTHQENTEAIPTSNLVYDTIQDIQGNLYPVIAIGEQIWMAKNLELTEFDCDSDQEVIFTNGLERSPPVAFYDNKLRYAYYKNDPKLGYGVIYTYSMIKNCNLCPEGYRVPTKSDWETLIKHIDDNNNPGKELLLNGNTGFNALLGGRIDSYGSVLANQIVFFWSQDLVPLSKQNIAFVFEIHKSGIIKLIGQDKKAGQYIRCVKDK